MDRILRIVHLEDDPLDSELVAGVLRREGLAAKIDRVDTLEQFRKALVGGGYDLVLSDYAMPQLDPLEALRLTRTLCPELPYIFVSGTLGEEQAVETLRLGATDYVLKQRIERLALVIGRALREAEQSLRRRRAEGALRESERRLALAASGAQIGMFDWNFSTGEVLATEQQMRLLGLTTTTTATTTTTLSQAYHYHQWAQRVHPDDLPQVEAELRRALARRAPCDLEYRVIFPDGSVRWVASRGVFHYDAQGQPSHMHGMVMDITERKLGEQRLAEQARLLDLTSDAIFVRDPSDRITYWNRGATEAYGFTAEEALGKNPHELLRTAFSEPLEEIRQQMRRTDSWVGELVHTRKDGTTLIVMSRWRLDRDAAGEPASILETNTDITKRKETEAELAAAKAAAEQASRAKDHFLAVLSHELRTPLTPVVMGVAMLQDRNDLDPAMRDTLEMIRRNVEMEARLIDDLLDVTRIARGKVELQRRRVELGMVIQRAVEVCRPDIEARGLEFGVDLGPGAPYWVEADVARLQQVFWNLLKNSIKFTPQGGCLGIRCRPEGDHVLVEVNDSGIGLDREALPRVFNAFEQVERSITRQFGGLGLGLAISKALVEMHGGTIEAQSEGRDKGATFRVRLPLVSPLGCSAGRYEAPSPKAATRHAGRPLRVLLVEDHGVTAKMMCLVLTAEGYAVETAGDVATAVRMADQHPFDLLLSDLGLPDGSGHDLMRQLREHGHTFPGIALSGYGQEEDILRSSEAGFIAHLTKPASRETVIAAVASATAGESADAL